VPARRARRRASCLVSGAEIYNEILRRRPDLAPLLFEPFHWDWRRQDHEAPADTYTSPIVSLEQGVFSMYAGSLYILTAQDYEGVPKLTDDQIEVLRLFDEITYEPGMAIEMDFRPGDIQWLSNYAALHARTTFGTGPSRSAAATSCACGCRARAPARSSKASARTASSSTAPPRAMAGRTPRRAFRRARHGGAPADFLRLDNEGAIGPFSPQAVQQACPVLCR
jgi:hypothetical protein